MKAAIDALIGERTYRSLRTPERFSLRRIDRVAAKGKEQAITLYEVLDAESPERRRAKLSTREILENVLECYFAREFGLAVELLERARSLDPQDTVLVLLAERCTRYAAKPPPPEWQGFETLLQK